MYVHAQIVVVPEPHKSKARMFFFKEEFVVVFFSLENEVIKDTGWFS